MKKILLLAGFLCIASISFAQTTPHSFWEAQHPMPVGNTLRAVKIFDSANYIMCGDIGTIVRTSDDGTTWKVQAKLGGLDRQLKGMAFSDRAHGIVVGTLGAIFYTADSGTTWTEAPAPTTSTLNDVAYATPNILVAVGQNGVLVRSQDSGKTWKVLPIEASYHLRSVVFISPDSGYVTGVNGYVFTTIDSGVSWLPHTFTFNNNLYDISFHGNHRDVAMAAEVGGIFLSHDGGATFARQTNVAPWGNVNSIIQLTPMTIIAVCDYRAIYVSTNAGANWRNAVSFGSDHLNAISFSDLKQGVAVGNAGVVLRTYDGGQTWTAVFDRVSDDKSGLRGIAAIDDNTVVACGSEGLIVKSTNGGKTWRKIPSNTYNTLRAIHFSTPKVGTICGDSGMVLRTQNGGESWYKISAPTGASLYALSFLDTATGIVVGNYGTIYRTQNGGNVWNKITYDDTLYLNSVSFNTKDNVVIGGVRVVSDSTSALNPIRPVLLVSDDGGFTFIAATLSTPFMGGIRALSFPVPNVGYAAGWYTYLRDPVGAVAKTTDGGHTWAEVAKLPAEPQGISFKRPNFGTAVGLGGKTYHTTTGGATWDSVETYTTLNLYAVSHASLKYAWASGAKTIILRQTSDDVENAVHDQSPAMQKAEMLSNYPNPFGVSGTTFMMKLPESSRISLRMYSATGAEIEAVYDGFFPAGEHTIGWLPKDLAAGIYFVVLEACGKREMVKIVVEK